MKVLVFIIIFYIGHLRTFSQSFAEKTISVESIGINKGLSQGMINCIWQDHFGFMWFGTMDGLNRYDGYKFQVFRNSTSDSNSISGNFITSIFEDSKARLWIGTALNGLNLFIPEKEQFIHYTMASQPALSNNTVLSIQEDKTGAIWVGTQSGLNKITVSDHTVEKKETLVQSIYQVPLNDASGNELFTNKGVEANFLITKNGTIWVSAANAIFKITPLKSGEEKIEKQSSVFSAVRKNGKRLAQIYKIIEDTTNGLLCFKSHNAITIINEKSHSVSQLNCGTLIINGVRNQVVCEKGILWERTENGLFCFDLLRKKMYRVRSDNQEHDKILGSAFSLYKDRSGITWIGSGGYGLLKYNPRTEYFHKTTTKSISWMSATPSGAVVLLTPEEQYLIKTQAQNGADILFEQKQVQLTKHVPGVAVQDKQGTYWMHQYGLAKAVAGKKAIQLVKRTDEVMFPYFLDNRDRLWYATHESFCLFDKRTGKVTCYRFPIMPAVSSPYKFCEVIHQDAKGIFWLGTTAGLFSFNETTQRWQHYKNSPGDSTSLSTNIVFTLCDDPQFPGSYIWAGTNGGGLNRLCIQTGRFEHIGIKEGLPNMVVYGILADEDKGLWISTNSGIACLKPKYAHDENQKQERLLEVKFRYYYEESGLQSNEFNRYSYCKTKNGILFFGGVSGFNYFNPKQVTGNQAVPAVVITDFKISNRPVLLSIQSSANKEGKSLLSKPVFLTRAIVLPYSDNMVSFDFASLDFTASSKNLYRYKMEGFDKEWIQSGNSNSATYTNLDPGEYTFTVKGSNSNGIWNENGTSIHLTVLAPWYMTWWFRVVLFATTAGLIYAFFRYSLHQKLKLYELRNGIASDLHDEIGSTLSSVYIYSEVAQQTTNTVNTKTSAYLKQISTDTGEMINALSDIVWTVNSKNDRFENIIHRMRATAVDLFEAKGYNLHLEFSGQLNILQLVMMKRKNFYLFYKEAINNVVKYANGKNIWITLAYSKPNIRLTIKDDGTGFVLDSQRSGSGMANMQRRAAELKGTVQIISSPGNGTEINLSFQA